MKKVFKKKIIITGEKGLLGSYFYKKYKDKYNIIAYPHRIENVQKQIKWFKKKEFNYFIHFAALTNKKKTNKYKLINTTSSINLIKNINKSKIKNFKLFLFISTSHVYGFSNKEKIENEIRNPINAYGMSKKRVEDFIFENKNKLNFKVCVARIFNFTGYNQKPGHFVPDAFKKIKYNRVLHNVDQYRDFIHIDDVCGSLEKIINKSFEGVINICSGKKINLLTLCKKISKIFFKNKLIFISNKNKQNLYGSNKKLRKLGMSKFQNINKIIRSYKL